MRSSSFKTVILCGSLPVTISFEVIFLWGRGVGGFVGLNKNKGNSVQSLARTYKTFHLIISSVLVYANTVYTTKKRHLRRVLILPF